MPWSHPQTANSLRTRTVSFYFYIPKTVVGSINGLLNGIELRVEFVSTFFPLGLLTERMLLLNSSEIILSKGSSQEGINDSSHCGELMIS